MKQHYKPPFAMMLLITNLGLQVDSWLVQYNHSNKMPLLQNQPNYQQNIITYIQLIYTKQDIQILYQKNKQITSVTQAVKNKHVH